MPGVSARQVARAKEWDLLSYLQACEPQELKKRGGEYYTASHDSLKISNGKWHWHSRGIGGRTALDYLVKVRGMDFVSAVEALCGESGAAAPMRGMPAEKQGEGTAGKEGQEKKFYLPDGERIGTAVVPYLQKRGIASAVISRCISLDILYESRGRHNCVFVGYDPEGMARYAALRGTGDNFKMEIEGSDKRYSFFIPAREKGSASVAVAESPVDAMSVASLLKMQGEDWAGSHYLSLGGTAPKALLSFLKNHPSVTRVSLCMDNDEAGCLGMAKIREALRADAELSGRVKEVADNPPPAAFGKDYNELLQKKAAALKKEKTLANTQERGR